MNKLLSFLCLFIFASSFAQHHQYNIENLKVTDADVENTSSPVDSTANAFYIYERGFSRFEEKNEYNLITDYEAKIKILNEKGYEHADVAIRLGKSNNKKEELKDLKAITYFMDNGVKKSLILEPEKIYTEENEDYDLVKFTFPAVSPGSVVVYSYQVESPFIFKFHTWWFQSNIPKLASFYETKIPGNYQYHIKKVGELELDLNEVGVENRCFSFNTQTRPADCLHSNYGMYNIPAFTIEPFLTSRYNFQSRIEYELEAVHRLDGYVKKYTRSWEDVDKEILKDGSIGKQLKRRSLVKNLLPEEITAKPNTLEKAKDIYGFVKKNYKWNGEYRIFADMDLKDLLKDGNGNVSAINTLLHNLYESEGFDVNPVLASSRENGVITKIYPVLSDFNYLLVQLELEDQKYLLDATEEYAAFGHLPFRALNSYARMLNLKGNSDWLDIIPEGFSNEIIRDSIKVNSNGIATGKSQHSFSGYHALRVRNALSQISLEDVFNKITSPNIHTKAKNVEILNRDELSEELLIKYALNNEGQKINNAIYLNPFSFKLFEKNPFQAIHRTYPIDFGYKDTYSYGVQIEIPDNHEVVDVPEQRLLVLPENGGTLQFIAQKLDERNIMVYFKVLFPKTIYSSGYQPYLKKFFDAILEIQDNSIIVIQEKT